MSNKFGWMLKRSLKGKKFVIQGPPCTVVWAPAYLDQSKFGNSTPDPKRKKDKWSMTLKTTSQKFADFYNKLCSQGATFNASAYLYRIPVVSIV